VIDARFFLARAADFSTGAGFSSTDQGFRPKFRTEYLVFSVLLAARVASNVCREQ
jgi:hypothetical protein